MRGPPRGKPSRSQRLCARGYSVWRDDDLPSHRTCANVIEEQPGLAKAVVVIRSAEAVRSRWARSEADRVRGDDKLAQRAVDDDRELLRTGPALAGDDV